MTTPNRPVLVLTNDDGLDEPGLAALHRAAEGLGRRVVVAPAGPKSSCSHAVTTHEDLVIEPRGADRYAVHGTPADCVRLALHHLVEATDWVLSGINAGGNLGADIHHSGTVAAVREGVLHGRPGIAFSHYIARGRPIDWDRAAGWAERVLRLLIDRPWEPGTLWNVNLPHPEPGGAEPEIIFCPVDPSPLPLRFRLADDGLRARYDGDYHGRPRIPGGDVAVCFRGDIAVSRIRLLAGEISPGSHLADDPEATP